MKICAVCKAECQDNMKFCLNCGNPFPISSEAVILEEKSEEKEEATDQGKEEISEEPIKENKEQANKNEESEKIKKIEPPSEETDEAKEPEVLKNDVPAEKIEAVHKETDDEYEDDDEYYEDEDISNKPMSVTAVISLIFAIIGVVSCGFGCVLSFSNLLYAAAFFVPALVGAILGIVGMMTSGRNTPNRGKPLAIIGTVISLISIILWIVCIFLLKNQASDMMSVISIILKN